MVARQYQVKKNKSVKDIVDGALIFDNSEGKHELLADKQIDGLLNIVNQEKFNLLKEYYDNN